MLERRFCTVVERAHLLPRPQRQVRATSTVGVLYRDTEFPGGLIVELDGRIVHNTVALAR